MYALMGDLLVKILYESLGISLLLQLRQCPALGDMGNQGEAHLIIGI